MKINWFTVIAEVINFLILVWLLRRFLYKPVLKAIDERENKIASQLKDAADKETKAKKEQDEFDKKNEAFDQKKKGLMDKAVADTNIERDKLLEIARNDAAALRSKLENALKATQEQLSHDIMHKTQQEVFEIARKTLSDLFSMSLEEQSANIFIKRIKELKKDEKKQFSEAFKVGSNLVTGKQSPILIQSAFDLPGKQQTDIKNAVNELLGHETQFQFKTAPEIIGGIELNSNGYKLAWSISEYLNSLQKSISDTLNIATKKDETKKAPVEAKKKSTKAASTNKPEKARKVKPKAKLKSKLKAEKTK
jgi:F-type H+-transporting ATPase subunit b